MAMVLITDDDTSTRAFLRHYLSRMGHDSVEASDGLSSLSTIRTARIDLLLTDLEMPGMGGLKLIAALRSDNKTLPIVALSGHPDMLEKAMLAGVQAAITKPVRYATLEPVIAILLPRPA